MFLTFQMTQSSLRYRVVREGRAQSRRYGYDPYSSSLDRATAISTHFEGTSQIRAHLASQVGPTIKPIVWTPSQFARRYLPLV